jgi:hypothetical protein
VLPGRPNALKLNRQAEFTSAPTAKEGVRVLGHFQR